MEEKNSTRINEIKNTCLDTATETTKDWLSGFIKKYLPKLFDWSENKVKSLISSIVEKDKKERNNSIKNIIFQGIEIGENNKEKSIIIAMKKEGLSDEMILKIIKESNQYLIKRKDIDKDKKS